MAPSGGNSQPWRFEVSNDETLDIIALPEKDHPILNFRYRGTWVAHGALLENILVASSFLGYKAEYEIFPDRSIPNLTVRIHFDKIASSNESLYSAIKLRATNRKKYQPAPLTVDQKKEILETAREIGTGEVRLIEDKEKMSEVAKAMSVNEIVMLENKILHDLFFREVVWTEKEEKKRGGGLYLKTLELKPPQQALFKLLRYWRVMSLFNKIGFAKIIAKDNAAVYGSGAAMGAIIVDDKDEEFINAGRLLERIWLKSTKMGLSLQLITGGLFLWQKISGDGSKDFSASHTAMIKDAYEQVRRTFDVKDGVAALLFRVGIDGSPSARSIKLPPRIIFK